MSERAGTSTDAADDGKIRDLLSNRDFLKIWGIGMFGGTMRWLELLANGLFVYDLTASPFYVALMMVIRFTPILLFGAAGGVLADRFNRKIILTIAFATMAVSSGALGTLAYLGTAELWHIAVVAFVNGLCWSTDLTVRRTMIGEIAGPTNVGRAMALDSATANSTRMLGPLLGGVVYAAIGLSGAYWGSTAVYVVCVIAAVLIRYRPTGLDKKRDRFFTAMKEGFAYARRDSAVMGTLAVTVAMNMFGFPYASMMPVLGKDELLLGPTLIGVLSSAEGAGAFLGALVIAGAARPAWFARIYLYGSMIFISGIALLSLMPAFTPALGLMMVAGVGVAGFSTMQSTIMFLVAPPEMRGRLMGVLALCIGAGPIGLLHVGWLADEIGVRNALMTIGLEGLFFILLSAIIWPQIRK